MYRYDDRRVNDAIQESDSLAMALFNLELEAKAMQELARKQELAWMERFAR